MGITAGGNKSPHALLAAVVGRSVIASPGRLSSPHRVKSRLGRRAAAQADDRDSFPNYKNLLPQEIFVQKANIYAGGGGGNKRM